MIPNIIGKNIKIYENFLTSFQIKEFDVLQSEDGTFPWFYSKIISEDDIKETDKEFINDQFVHTIYNNFSQQSHFFNLCRPILAKLDAKAVWRIKINLTLPTKEPMPLGTYHNDLTWSGKVNDDAKIAIYYPAENNGKLLVKEEEEEHTIENCGNQLIQIPNTYKHLGISNTDGNNRYAVNIVYF